MLRLHQGILLSARNRQRGHRHQQAFVKTQHHWADALNCQSSPISMAYGLPLESPKARLKIKPSTNASHLSGVAIVADTVVQDDAVVGAGAVRGAGPTAVKSSALDRQPIMHRQLQLLHRTKHTLGQAL